MVLVFINLGVVALLFHDQFLPTHPKKREKKAEEKQQQQQKTKNNNNKNTSALGTHKWDIIEKLSGLTVTLATARVNKLTQAMTNS